MFSPGSSPGARAKAFLSKTNPIQKLAVLSNALKSITKTAEKFKNLSQLSKERETRARSALLRTRIQKRTQGHVQKARLATMKKRLAEVLKHSGDLESKVEDLGIQLVNREQQAIKDISLLEGEKMSLGEEKGELEERIQVATSRFQQAQMANDGLKKLHEAVCQDKKALEEVNLTMQTEFLGLKNKFAKASKEADEAGGRIRTLEQNLAAERDQFAEWRRKAEAVHAAVQGRLERELKERQDAEAAYRELRNAITAVCRVRPDADSKVRLMNSATAEPEPSWFSTSENRDSLIVLDGEKVVLAPEKAKTKHGQSALELRKFGFSRVFAPEASQQDVFNYVGPICDAVVTRGDNGTVFCYGQTGGGKTHTMLGRPEDPGLVTRCIERMYAKAASISRDVEFEVTVCEAHNGRFYDMTLPAASAERTSLSVLGGNVSGLAPISESTAGGMVSKVLAATTTRVTAATDMNDSSSRSHMLITVHCSSRGAAVKTGVARKSRLVLIDLAGSECSHKSGVYKGAHQTEASFVNKSLSALGDVLLALKQRAAYVPYRNSKLTEVLKDSMCGNGKMVLITNISAHPSNLLETRFVLKFGVQASNVDRS